MDNSTQAFAASNAASMASLANSASYSLTKPSKTMSPAEMWKSAKDFESMTINQMIQPMFDTIDLSKSEFGGGEGEKTWMPMMVQEFSKKISDAGGIGLAQPVYNAMLHMQEAAQNGGGNIISHSSSGTVQ